MTMAMRRNAVRIQRKNPSKACCAARLTPLAACIRALIAGGLIVVPAAYAELPQVLPGGRWQGALDPRIVNGGADMVIDQIERRATLDWQSFNIGAGYGVQFNQPSSSAVALNRIHALDPSLINGRLTANGQVYLINRNGIVFGRDAQVDVNTLIASTLDIDDTVFANGILGAIQNNEAAFVAGDGMDPDATIAILDGAHLRASQGDAGRIVILAPHIVNGGSIETPDGQAILAAARDRVYLAQSGDTDLRGLLVEVQTGGDVRNVGSIVAERGNVSILGLSVNQSGLVRATSSVALNGSIRLVAGDNGGSADPARLDINTPRANNVDGQFFDERGGELVLGAGSVTEVLPAGDERAADGQTQPGSFVDMAGRSVTLEGGARVTVTGGAVNILAKSNPDVAFGGEPGTPEAGVGVRLESGARIDVSGDASTVVSVARNVIQVEARGTELADSPLQRDGAIRNQTLAVDIRQGTPFLNIDGAQALIQRGVGERFSAGGTVNIASTGDVVVEDGASIDIRGGQVSYTGATVATSKLVTADGRVFDIADADPRRTYVGVLGGDLTIDYAKWGVSRTFAGGLARFEDGYVEGKDAGTLQIAARRLAFNGDLLAGSSAGRHQRLAPGLVADALTRPFDQRAHGGSLLIDLSTTLGVPEFVIAGDADRLPTPARGAALDDALASVLSADMLAASRVSALSVTTGGSIAIEQALNLPDNAELRLAAGRIDVNADIRSAGGAVGMEALKSTGITASGNGIVVPNAEVGLRVAEGVRIDVSGRWSNDSPRLNVEPPSAPIVIDGGTISLRSGGDLTLAAGSVLDVSAGAHLGTDGRLRAGRGGTIELNSTDNRSGLARTPTRLEIEGELRGFALEQGGTLSLTANGLLIADQAYAERLLAEQLPGGGARYALSGTGMLRSLTAATDGAQTVLVDPALFRSGGFSGFDLAATRSGLAVADGTRIALRAENYLLDSTALVGFVAGNPAALAGGATTRGSGNPLELVPAGTDLEAFTRIGTQPGFRRLPVDLGLASANGFAAGIAQDYPVLAIGAGAAIVADPGARITLDSDTSLFVDGLVHAPAGHIALQLDTGFNQYAPQQMIRLGGQARLSAPGAVMLTPNERGLRLGEVLDAGTVTLRADFGSIVTAAGSRIEVDGVATTLDLPTLGGAYAPVGVAGHAGRIDLTAAESILLQGSLSGRGAVPGAVGGSLSVTLDPTRRPSEQEEAGGDAPVPLASRYPSGPRIVNLAAYAGTLPQPGDAVPGALNGQAFLAPAQIVAGGFGSLALTALTPGSSTQPDRPDSLAVIRFGNDVDLRLAGSIRLDAPVLDTGGADVRLSAPYVALGSTDTRFRVDGAAPSDGGGIIQADPSGGAGRLRVEAGLIDLIGDSVVQGAGAAGATAAELLSRGDIRLRGTRLAAGTEWQGSFRVAGDLLLQAQQLYPTTLSDFRLAVEADAGTLELRGQSGIPGQPLSAGGRVELHADHIVVREGARVRAPLGEIALTGDHVDGNGVAVGARSITLERGALLSASAAGLSIPFGATQFQKDLVMGVDGVGTLQFVADPETRIERGVPEKRIALSADAIDVQPGAVFDLSGGGDVRAVEFIPGPGGSRDILLADLDTGAGVEPNGAFAILPLLGSEFAAYDPIETAAMERVQNFAIGSVLVLDEGMDGLPAGRYAILPARYALFGGYLVTPVDNSLYLPAGRNLARLDGVRIVSGRYAVAGSEVVDNRAQGFAIEDGARVRLRAEYAESSLDTLFAGQSVRTPRDAGTLSLAAGAALRLAGTLTPNAAGGRGSAVDIVANELSILSRPNGGSGIELLAADLAGLNADSLLIGATRRLGADGLTIDPRAARIDVADGVDLETRELILVADRLNLGSGAGQPTRLAASGPAGGAADPLHVTGNAAVAMVSSSRGATLTRVADATAAVLNVAANVTLAAPGSIVVDANGDVNLAGTLDAAGASLALGGASISLGETDGLGLSGLVLSNADLDRLAGSDLSLRSGAAVAVYGALARADGGALDFARLAIDARGILGQANAGTQSRIAADSLELRNSTGSALAAVGDGGGTLNLQAGEVLLDRGAFALHGYDSVTLRATDYALARGTGVLNVAGALTLDAPLLTASGGAERGIVSSGLLTISGGAAQASLPQAAGLGARLNLEGAAIAYAGNILLPSGDVRLTADGNVILDAGANIDVAGRDADFAVHAVGTPGGRIRVESRTADVSLGAGARLDVSGAASGGAAGRIELIAPNGTLALAPTAQLRAVDSGERRGEVVVDAGVLASTDTTVDNVLTSLNGILEAGGFRGRRDLRVRSGDLHLASGETMRTGEIRLTADGGRLVIDGTLDASGADGGAIALAAGDSLDINGTLDAHATTADGDGGRVELAALDADGDDHADGTRDDVVNLNPGSVIDVRGGVNGKGGTVLVRARVFDGDGNGSRESVASGRLDASVVGAARADVEAVHAVSDSVITTADMNLWRAMLEQFMADNTADLPATWRLVPGLEVSSGGDITLQNAWDFYANAEDADPANDWRFGAGNDLPGIVTLRAAGSVRVNQSLSDLFVDDVFLVAGSEVPYQRLGVGESWRYRIVAGADTASADVMAVSAHAAGDILLANNAIVRTGSGDVELAASRHIDLGAGAALYTAGLNSGFGPLGDADINLAAFENIIFFPDFDIRPATGEEFLLAYLNKGQFPVSGGAIRITAGGDLRGQASQVNTTAWQPRVGGSHNNGSGVNFQNLPTHWAIAFERFVNGIGTLGGGDISARVGGDLRNLALALPTTGKPDAAQIVTNTVSLLGFSATMPTPRISGGGSLMLDVGGNLTGGALHIDRGDARVRVGGNLGDGTQAQQPYFAIADTRVQVEARGTLNVGGVFNNSALPQSGNLAAAVYASPNLGGSYDALFFGYTPEAAARLTALTGDILLRDPAPIRGQAFGIYAPTLQVHSLQGGIRIDGDLQTYPAARGQLELLAHGDIRHVAATGNNLLIQSDADPGQLPSAVRPNVGQGAVGNTLAQYLTPPASGDSADITGRRFHAETPVHAGDAVPNLVVSRGGSIVGKSGPLDAWEFLLAKQTLVSAGADIRDMSFRIQHTGAADISVLSAGGDLVQTLSRNPNNGSFTASKKIIEIAGPGRLDVIAGRNIDLGTSRGIVSVGNTANPALAEAGADIGLLAGVATAPDYEGFIRTYLETGTEYLDLLNGFLAARGSAAGGDPVGAFRALTSVEQRALLYAILFNELKESGTAAAGSANADYSRGFAAIATLFPDAATRGDISTPVSVVKTIDGGDIALLAPYGGINAGATFRTLEKKPDDLGIITGRGGVIEIFLDGDLQVNRERVFALQDDLLVWSSNGSIDAGKGAKTVTSVPDPIITFDANGNAVVTFPPAVDGSGLNAGGNAYLFAPRGAINAGDAGIRTGGNLTLGAVEVIGTDNIDVGGVSVGVPASASVPTSVTDAGSLSSSATSMAEDSAGAAGGAGDGNGQGGETLGLLSVEVVGFGDPGATPRSDVGAFEATASDEDDDEDKRR